MERKNKRGERSREREHMKTRKFSLEMGSFPALLEHRESDLAKHIVHE